MANSRDPLDSEERFSKVDYETSGFLGFMGPNETVRRFLGKVDRLLSPAVRVHGR